MKKPLIAIQVGAISFLDEGVNYLLDSFQEKGINTLFLATHSFDPGTASRQIQGHPFPDHGKQEYDNLVGGNFATNHQQFYNQTSFKDFKANDYGENYDILEEVLPQSRKRDMEIYCWITESPNYNLPQILPGFWNVLEEDVFGNKIAQPCLNHPDYRNMYLSLVEDYIKSYDIDGLAFCSERQGPLGNFLNKGWGGTDIACFCPHCQKIAREKGIDVQRAKNGYKELLNYYKNVNQGNNLTQFLKILLQYPEILAWERLYIESQFKFYRDVYGTAKVINQNVQIGWHIMHLNSFNPFYQAQIDLNKITEFSDFLKLALYQNCTGSRFKRMIDHFNSHIFKDIDTGTITNFIYQALGLKEADFNNLSTASFSGKYVETEVKRALEMTQKKVKIYAGIGIDIPANPENRSSLLDIEAGIKSAFKGGANGIILSRKYSEMGLENLKHAGNIIKAFKLE